MSGDDIQRRCGYHANLRLVAISRAYLGKPTTPTVTRESAGEETDRG